MGRSRSLSPVTPDLPKTLAPRRQSGHGSAMKCGRHALIGRLVLSRVEEGIGDVHWRPLAAQRAGEGVVAAGGLLRGGEPFERPLPPLVGDAGDVAVLLGGHPPVASPTPCRTPASDLCKRGRHDVLAADVPPIIVAEGVVVTKLRVDQLAVKRSTIAILPGHDIAPIVPGACERKLGSVLTVEDDSLSLPGRHDPCRRRWRDGAHSRVGKPKIPVPGTADAWRPRRCTGRAAFVASVARPLPSANLGRAGEGTSSHTDFAPRCRGTCASGLPVVAHSAARVP